MAEGIGEVVNVNVGGILYTTTLATLTKVISIFLYFHFYISIFWFLYFFSLISMFLYLISISINILYILYKFILYKYYYLDFYIYNYRNIHLYINFDMFVIDNLICMWYYVIIFWVLICLWYVLHCLPNPISRQEEGSLLYSMLSTDEASR